MQVGLLDPSLPITSETRLYAWSVAESEGQARLDDRAGRQPPTQPLES